MVDVGKYTIHGSYGNGFPCHKLPKRRTFLVVVHPVSNQPSPNNVQVASHGEFVEPVVVRRGVSGSWEILYIMYIYIYIHIYMYICIVYIYIYIYIWYIWILYEPVFCRWHYPMTDPWKNGIFTDMKCIKIHYSCRQVYRSSHGSFRYGSKNPAKQLKCLRKGCQKKGICLPIHEFAAWVLPTVGVKWWEH